MLEQCDMIVRQLQRDKEFAQISNKPWPDDRAYFLRQKLFVEMRATADGSNMAWGVGLAAACIVGFVLFSLIDVRGNSVTASLAYIAATALTMAAAWAGSKLGGGLTVSSIQEKYRKDWDF